MGNQPWPQFQNGIRERSIALINRNESFSVNLCEQRLNWQILLAIFNEFRILSIKQSACSAKILLNAANSRAI